MTSRKLHLLYLFQDFSYDRIPKCSFVQVKQFVKYVLWLPSFNKGEVNWNSFLTSPVLSLSKEPKKKKKMTPTFMGHHSPGLFPMSGSLFLLTSLAFAPMFSVFIVGTFE